MKRLLANLSARQRITMVLVALAAAAGIYSLVHYQREADFKPLFTGLAPEDAAAIVQKLKEGGIDYRLPESGGAVLAPSARLAELRLTLAAAGLPKAGRIGFELFDKANLGATEFTEHINYRRALEGELERSVAALAEVEQARVHITFPKDSVFLDAQQPAKASVLVKTRPGAHLSPQNVQAIDHLVSSAVEGLSPDAVSVLDMNGNLLGRPRPEGSLDGPESSEAALEYRHHLEADLLAKVNSTLEPLLGANRFRAGVSVDCDFSGGEQSEEIYDPARSVMLSSERTEDGASAAAASGVPGTASALPRPTSRPSAGARGMARVTENITYQSSRTVKKMRLPAGAIRKMSLAVLVDQGVTWQPDRKGYQRVLLPPPPEKLKIIRDLVAGVTGFSAERGDQITIETLPFETTLELEPPGAPQGAPAPAKPAPAKWGPVQLEPRVLLIGGGILAAIVLALVTRALRRKAPRANPPEAPGALPEGQGPPAEIAGPPIEDQIESKLAEREAMQRKIDAQALNSLKLAPVITKTAEVLAKHLREKIKQEPEVSAQILHTWIREEENT
jgi:flagellar M-ring protein FliF